MPEIKPDHITGSILALALGDAFGAPHEGGLLERAVWRLIGTTGGRRRWTDDTRMSIDVIESLLACGGIDQDDLARRFADSYRWSRGYGPGAARLLKRIRRGQSWRSANRAVYRDGSLGNGGAMRAPAVGLFYGAAQEAALVAAADAAAEVTHAHPLGREGAVLIALATALAAGQADSADILARLVRRSQAPEFTERLRLAGDWLQTETPQPSHRVAAQLGHGMAASASCVTAVYAALALRAQDFDALLGYVLAIGGDVDTIAAMAGAIWGAARGCAALPAARLAQLEARAQLTALAEQLAAAAGRRAAGPGS